jgi:hypothetical protein
MERHAVFEQRRRGGVPVSFEGSGLVDAGEDLGGSGLVSIASHEDGGQLVDQVLGGNQVSRFGGEVRGVGTVEHMFEITVGYRQMQVF